MEEMKPMEAGGSNGSWWTLLAEDHDRNDFTSMEVTKFTSMKVKSLP